jgi:hypothetical protein
MRHRLWLVAGSLLLGACSSNTIRAIGFPGGRNADVVVVDDSKRGRELKVPPGHYPPAGKCRIWYGNRPPGHQPPPARCESLVGRVPAGAFLLYNRQTWDTKYDWRGLEKRKPGSVPSAVMRIMIAM